MRIALTHGLARLLVLVVGLSMPGCAAAGTQGGPSAGGPKFFAWDNFERTDKPNNWLVAPTSPGFPDADEVAPVFDVDPDTLAQAWKGVIEDQPRTEILAISDDGLQIEAQQTSATFGFVDRVSSRIIALEEKKSTIAIYSRSTVGYWDLGVNRRRVQDWLGALAGRLSDEPG